MCIRIDPLADDVIKGGALFTNWANVYYAGGILIVRGFSPASGQYHETYTIGIKGFPSKSDVLRCLNEGYKYVDLKRLVNRLAAIKP